jgi:hypothetical protein
MYLKQSNLVKYYMLNLNLKLKIQVEKKLREKQYDFRDNRSTADLIFAER